MEYLSVAKTAEKWDISQRGVRNYCSAGRIPGAFLTGKTAEELQPCLSGTAVADAKLLKSPSNAAMCAQEISK